MIMMGVIMNQSGRYCQPDFLCLLGTVQPLEDFWLNQISERTLPNILQASYLIIGSIIATVLA